MSPESIDGVQVAIKLNVALAPELHHDMHGTSVWPILYKFNVVYIITDGPSLLSLCML